MAVTGRFAFGVQAKAVKISTRRGRAILAN
jgi:hypothetical protein